jgi:hypothetical protein
MAYKLSVLQAQTPGQYAWQIVDSERPGWEKRSLLSFRSSGLATAAGIAEVKNLSRQKNAQPLRPKAVGAKISFWTSVFQNFQRRFIGAR